MMFDGSDGIGNRKRSWGSSLSSSVLSGPDEGGFWVAPRPAPSESHRDDVDASHAREQPTADRTSLEYTHRLQLSICFPAAQLDPSWFEDFF